MLPTQQHFRSFFRLRTFYILKRNNHARFPELVQGALEVLQTSDPHQKAKLARKISRDWFQEERETSRWPRETSIKKIQEKLMDEPENPPNLNFASHSEMGSHKKHNVSLSVWLIHSLAHVEYNAINLAFDMIVRWAHCYNGQPIRERNEVGLPIEFYEDWLDVACDESRHQWCLQKRLEDLSCYYGKLPVHNSLWSSAADTMNTLTGRLVVIPLVQEARGLDAHPRMVDRILGSGDKQSAQLVDLICSEETSHVQKGIKWFSYVCNQLNYDVEEHFANCVRKYVPGGELLPPFNVWAREQAGMAKELYISVAAPRKQMEANITNNVIRIAMERDKFRKSLQEQIDVLDSE